MILYLPPGPLFQGLDQSISSLAQGNPDYEESSFGNMGKIPAQHVLASTASATVVTVNYRLGITPSDSMSGLTSTPTQDQAISDSQKQPEHYKFPTPIHDTLAGFDWIQDTLNPATVGVFGSHIGGSLALMLALTEAQSVHAVSAMEPVCDWPILDEYCAIEEQPAPEAEQDTTNDKSERKAPRRQPRKRTSRTSSPRDLIPLLKARERFFTSPERFFDAFASPILFLRSAGRDVPKAFPQYLTGPEYPVPTMKTPPRTTSTDQNSASEGSLWDRDTYPDLDADETGNDLSETSTASVRRRKALSRWPPYGLDYGLSGSGTGRIWSGPDHGIARLQVTLPWVRVWLARNGMPAGLVDVKYSSSATKNKEGAHETTVLARQGEEMVSVMRRGCFWGREKGFGERRVTLARVGLDLNEEVGGWFKSTFEGPMDED